MRPIGIDLGTTNTVVAVDGEAVSIPAEGGVILPSVVAFPPSGAELIGTRAQRRRSIDARNTIFSAKRVIGRPWHAREVEAFARRYPFDLVEHETGCAGFRTRAGVFTPADIGARVLTGACGRLPVDIDQARAVIAVPSEYGQAQRDATATVARLAGFGEVQVIDEPVATAIAYLGNAGPQLRHAVVYDLGGGTFDVAVLDCTREPAEVVGQGGDLWLGGDDLDLALAQWAADTVLERHRWDMRDNPVVFDRLIKECERAKVRLSYAEQTRIDLSQVDPGAAVAGKSIAVDQERVAALASDLVRRSFVICDEVLARAGVRPSSVDGVFLAGGSTQLPSVRAAVASYFGVAPRAEIDPMEVVAIGASVASRT